MILISKRGFVVHFRFLDQLADGEKDSEAETIYDASSDLEEGRNDESSTTDSSSATSASSVSDWIEPSMQLCCPNKSGMLQQKQGYGVVLEAICMIQKEPMVKVTLNIPSMSFFA